MALTFFAVNIENQLSGRCLPACGDKGDSKMRMWLLLILLACLAGALYLGFGQPEYGEKTAELLSELENL